MYKNYIKTAFRNLLKQKFYALINILGLAVGIACCLLIVLYVVDELSYDKYHEKSDRIYRLYTDIVFGEMDGKIGVMPAPMGPQLMKDYPEVESVVRFRSRGSYLIKTKDSEKENIKEVGFVFADREIFDVFTLNVLEGDPQTALSEPNTMVITKSRADLLFPEGDAMNQIVTLDNRYDYKIVGVIEDFPSNSHFRRDYFMSMEGLSESKEPVWVSHNFHTYVLLKEGTDPDAFEAKLGQMVETYVAPQISQFLNVDIENFKKTGNRINYYMEPLTDLHLRSDVIENLNVSGDIAYVWLFSAIAILILVIASINFMNLSTARSANRAREVGVRKVLGSVRSNLIAQFLVESLLITIISFFLAVFLAEILIPAFNSLSGKDLSIPYTNPWMLLSFAGGTFILGILAGMYPAFFLSAFQPVMVLKGKLSAGSSSSWLRSSLVVFQFAASIVLVVGTVIIYQQMDYIQNKKLGFSKDQILVVEDAFIMRDKVYSFKEELLKRPDIKNVSVSSFLPVENTDRNNTVFWPEGNQNEESQKLLQRWTVDHDYLATLDMKIVQGRAFSTEFSTDSQGMILNQTAVRNLGLENPIGQRISTYEGFDEEGGRPYVGTYTVVGVVEDFHFESLREKVTGLAFLIGRSTGFVATKVEAGDLKHTIAGIEQTWKEFAPGQPFNYSFLDERFYNMYQAEQRVGDILTAFSILAILVACLGLFALAAFMAEQRTREIGIRKVLGAGVNNIVVLLSRDFLKLVAISFVIALPIAFFAMNAWLQNYAFKIDLWEAGPIAVMIAAVIVLVITFISVSSQSLKAALVNPIHSLRNE